MISVSLMVFTDLSLSQTSCFKGNSVTLQKITYRPCDYCKLSQWDVMTPVLFCCSSTFVLVFHNVLWQKTTWHHSGVWVCDLLWSTKTKVNWFLARPSRSWAVYEPSSSRESWSNSISTRPLALSKLILRRCSRTNKHCHTYSTY